MRSIGPPGCWHGDNCSSVHCMFYDWFLEDSGIIQFESKPSLYCLLSGRQEHCVAIHCRTNLKGSIWERTHSPWGGWHLRRLVFIAQCLFYLSLQVTRQAPVGIQAHLPMPAGRQGTSKCAAKCALPAQWDIHCMAQQRGSASPMGPGLANSRSANVRETFKISLWCYVWNTLESNWELTHKYFFTQRHTFKLLQIQRELRGSMRPRTESR